MSTTAEYDVWRDKTDDEAYMRSLVENSEDLTIVGIVQPADDASAFCCRPASPTRLP